MKHTKSYPQSKVSITRSICECLQIFHKSFNFSLVSVIRTGQRSVGTIRAACHSSSEGMEIIGASNKAEVIVARRSALG